jgi:peptidoglycan/xylan/chitin deacetylase (PgdA/CDA1 family)
VSPPGNRNRPSSATRAARKNFDNANLAPLTDPLDEVARHIDGSFVLVVKVTGGRYRRRCFLTAASAERAARRAQDAGYNATVYLAELKPLWKLAGGAATQ